MPTISFKKQVIKPESTDDNYSKSGFKNWYTIYVIMIYAAQFAIIYGAFLLLGGFLL